jgi:hypothetical protein
MSDQHVWIVFTIFNAIIGVIFLWKLWKRLR